MRTSTSGSGGGGSDGRGEVVVVTGAAGALGSALVRTLRARGDRVAAIDTPSAAERSTALAAEPGPAALALAVALLAPGALSSALERVERELGAPTGAALVAGGWQGGAPLHAESDDATWRAMIDMNLETVHASLRALVPGMVARGRGSLVVIGSRAVERPWSSAGAAAYAASKSALVALAQAVAAEVLERGVRLNAVLPSVLDTPANRRAMPDADPSRWVSTDSLSEVIAFLLSDAARDVSGAAIPVYGRS